MLNNHEKTLCLYGIITFIVIWLFLFLKLFNLISNNSNEQLFRQLFLIFLLIISSVLITIMMIKLIQAKDKVFRYIFQNANDSMAILSNNGQYLWQNNANKALLGYSDEKLKQAEAFFLLKNMKKNLKDELDKFNEFSGIYKMPTFSEGYKDVWLSAFSVKDDLEDTLCYVAIKRDVREFLKIIDQIKKEKVEFEKKASMDFLTSLLNRNGFFNIMSNVYPLKGCIIFADIDKFKLINDTYGHDIGDVILKYMANMLKTNLRSSDMIARWGGEEFVIYLKNDLETSFEVFEKIRILLMKAKPNDINVTCSFGIAKIEGDLKAAILKADKALYRAKNTGRNKIVLYSKEMEL